MIAREILLFFQLVDPKSFVCIKMCKTYVAHFPVKLYHVRLDE